MKGHVLWFRFYSLNGRGFNFPSLAMIEASNNESGVPQSTHVSLPILSSFAELF